MSKYSQEVQDALNNIANGKLVVAETSIVDDVGSGKRIATFNGPDAAHFTFLIQKKGDNYLDIYTKIYANTISYIFEKQPDGSFLGTGNAAGWVSVQAYLPNPAP